MKNFRVTWHIAGRPLDEWTDTVLIVEGYSTLEDAPKILAIARLGDVDLAPLVTITETVEVSQ